jgi:cytochrome c-type biogenesis protein CcmE
MTDPAPNKSAWWMPKSKKARRRLGVVAVAGVVLAGALGLTLYGLGTSVNMYMSPSEARAENVKAGRTIKLGGCVEPGSLVHRQDGSISFVVVDGIDSAHVDFKGIVPDLFREGQTTVATGAFRNDGTFVATNVLAKHDENYRPRELEKTLAKSGAALPAGCSFGKPTA